MKWLFLLGAMLLCLHPSIYSQSIALNNSGAAGDASAVVDISSTTQGLLIPRMTQSQRSAILSPATGLFVYQTDGTKGLYYNFGTPASPDWKMMLGFTGSTGYTIRHNGSAWEATSALYIDASNNIGIGNTLPGARLHVTSSSTNFDQTLKITNTAAQGAGIYLDAQNKDWMIYASNAVASAGDQKLVFRDYSTATDHMVIDNNGYVGIGTMFPGLFSGSNKYLTVSAGDSYGANPVSLELQGANTSTLSPFAKIDFASYGTVADNAARIDARRGGSTNMGTLVFSTNDGTSLTERLRIKDAGNVGINTGNSTISTNALLSIKDGHIQIQQTTVPTVVLGNAGTGSSTSVTAVNPKSTDVTGRVSITTGTGAGTGAYVTVTYNKSYASNPVVQLTPGNANAAAAQMGLGIYVSNSTTSGFSIGFLTAAPSATTYTFNYLVIETQ